MVREQANALYFGQVYSERKRNEFSYEASKTPTQL